MTPSPTSFSADYAAARARFLDAAHAANASLASHDHPLTGPAGEALMTDVAWLGPPDAERVLVTVSATHGVEGFAGSAAQIDWLERGEDRRLRDCAALLVHAINPYGFAWQRRVTHENVDLNRNWIDFDAGLPQRAAYDALHAALCPADWSTAAQGRTFGELQASLQTMGLPAFAAVVSGGQHAHADGLFYGGAGPTHARITLESILRQRLQSARRVGIIDFHTGLGPPGHGELIVSAAARSGFARRAREWFGAAITTTGAEDSASAKLSGEWQPAAEALLPDAQVTAVALEFGTVDVFQVLNALRADNWLHTHGGGDVDRHPDVKRGIRAAFDVDSADWRGRVLGQALAVSRSALAGLQA